MFLYTMIKSFSKTPKSKTPKILYFGKDRPERTILLIAGTHGNEPAGSIYLSGQSILGKIKDCAKDYNIKIIVIPKVNELGFIQTKSLVLVRLLYCRRQKYSVRSMQPMRWCKVLTCKTDDHNYRPITYHGPELDTDTEKQSL